MSLLSVVMPVWSLTAEMRDMAEETINGLYNTSTDIDLIVIDNASNYPLAPNSLKKLSVVVNKENKGFTFAVNQGLLAADSEYVCVANSDLISIPEKWDLFLLDEEDLQSGILFPCPDSTDGLGWFPPGFMFMAHRETFARIGAFDERFFLFYSDSDYWVRARELGIPLIADASLKIKNRRRVTVDAGIKAGKLDSMQFAKDEAKFIHKYGGVNPLAAFREAEYLQVVNREEASAA